MQDEHDVWNTADVRRAIRRRIGQSLSAGYDLSKPLPERMHTLLARLDEPKPIAGNRSDRQQRFSDAQADRPRSSRPGGREVIEVPVRRQ
jgi:hypothetical protein